jgi:hypothetical protein
LHYYQGIDMTAREIDKQIRDEAALPMANCDRVPANKIGGPEELIESALTFVRFFQHDDSANVTTAKNNLAEKLLDCLDEFTDRNLALTGAQLAFALAKKDPSLAASAMKKLIDFSNPQKRVYRKRPISHPSLTRQ